MARPFTLREAGAIAWQADERITANPHPFASAARREWDAGWIAEQNAFEDSEFLDGLDFAGPSWAFEAAAERRQLGLSALD